MGKARPPGKALEVFADRPPEIPTGLLQDGMHLSLAFLHFEAELEKELQSEGRPPLWRHGRLMLHLAGQLPLWAATVWLEPEILSMASIGDAIRQLGARATHWGHVSGACHRRAALIAQGLRPVRRLRYLQAPPPRGAGGWMMLDENRMLVSARCSHPYPNGWCEFEEDKISPPSRAYLKLWELFTVHGIRPSAGERVLDMGASPGGWTWVLASLGCSVTAIDKAPLDLAVAAMNGVEYLQVSAFGLRPAACHLRTSCIIFSG